MLISFSTRAALLSSKLSVGHFIKHLPCRKSSNLKLSLIPARKSTLSFPSSSVADTAFPAASSADAVDAPHFQTLSSHQQTQIRLYIESLLQWNQKMNLTAVKEENEIMERHVEDSLAILNPVREAYLSRCGDSFDKLNVVDVGSGAGLPGLILAIACPGWEVTLLESMNKRCVFLKHVVDLIGLQNVRIVRDRAENVGHGIDFRESFDIAVARAVAEMRILAEYCLPLVRVGGLFVAAKGHDPQEEVTKAVKAIHLMGASLLKTCFVESHSKYGQRTAIVCLKDGSTPRKYPRSPELSYVDLSNQLHLVGHVCADMLIISGFI
ncbi:S-adenosyl-L-methionine-dependent methyltransferases superfamily protein [Striga hermonthica]|uniref:S-adenosyl-L-methionine-dependent methyltransferases superfamily protein n=1 Tax=Striga hermonthica TaxID=68872 RepID=A0A9N7N4Q9_STRHE|nr:S-adenosyl-L-methionine-dependent methyltransferases superfamily protein [Striga hermonthica]